MPILKTFKDDHGAPVKIWTDDVEASALEQLRQLSTLPFIHKQVAVMPDVHGGMGATVGSVIATKGAIIPAAVGVDIGCGMMADRSVAARRAICRTTCARCARRSRRPYRTAGPTTAARTTAARGATFRTRSRRRDRALADDGGSSRYRIAEARRRSQRGADAARHARDRQPLHRGLPRRGGPRLDHAALGLAWRRQPDRHATSSSWRRRTCGGGSSTCRTRTSPTCPRARSSSTTTGRRCRWAQGYALRRTAS